MRATYQELMPAQTPPPIQLICNQIEPVYVAARIASKQYRKVSKKTKAHLLKCIQKGWSIINVNLINTQVSKKFGINYSTAKSIVQNYKKKHTHKGSSTESFESSQELEIQ